MASEDRPFGSPVGGPLCSADHIYASLADFIGPNVTRMAIRTFAKKTLNRTAEDVAPAQAPQLVMALRPLLRSMAGEVHAEKIIKQLIAELR